MRLARLSVRRAVGKSRASVAGSADASDFVYRLHCVAIRVAVRVDGIVIHCVSSGQQPARRDNEG